MQVEIEKRLGCARNIIRKSDNKDFSLNYKSISPDQNRNQRLKIAEQVLM